MMNLRGKKRTACVLFQVLPPCRRCARTASFPIPSICGNSAFGPTPAPLQPRRLYHWHGERQRRATPLPYRDYETKKLLIILELSFSGFRQPGMLWQYKKTHVLPFNISTIIRTSNTVRLFSALKYYSPLTNNRY